MKTLLQSRNAALPPGSSSSLREVPSSVFLGSVIAMGTARRTPLGIVRRDSRSGRAEFWHHHGMGTMAARAA